MEGVAVWKGGPEVESRFSPGCPWGLRNWGQGKQRSWCWLGAVPAVLVTDFIFNKPRFVTLVSQ